MRIETAVEMGDLTGQQPSMLGGSKWRGATRSWLSSSSILKCVCGIFSLVFLSFFLSGIADKPVKESVIAPTPVIEHSTSSMFQPIESVQLGQRVATDITPEQLKEAIGDWEDLPQWDREEIEPESWRSISLDYEKPNGGILKIELLRPFEWLTDRQAKVGAEIHLVMKEMGVDGPAKVIFIGPSPTISDGSGRVVTGRFSHIRGGVMQIRMDSVDEPLGVTKNHPIYSVDQQAFVAAEHLKIGESLQFQDRTTHVVSVDRLSRQMVYNLEVQGEHVYRVMQDGLLVHNDCTAKATFINLGDNAAGRVFGTATRNGNNFSLNGKALDGLYDFVIRQDGSFVVGKGHVALSGGKPVVWAGDATFRGGKLAEWTNASGHFRPLKSFGGNAGLPLDKYRGVNFPIQVGSPQLPIFR